MGKRRYASPDTGITSVHTEFTLTSPSTYSVGKGDGTDPKIPIETADSTDGGPTGAKGYGQEEQAWGDLW